MPSTPQEIAAQNRREAAARAAEDADLTPEQRAARLDEAKARFDSIEPAPRSELHTYPDGSQRVGTPPFPKLSPKEEVESKLERVGEPPAPPAVIPGLPTSGSPAPSPAGGLTVDELAAKAQQQLESDVQSGKSPETPNPTTDSRKPELAGTADELAAEPTKEELEAIAKQIQPSAKGASDDQAQAAVNQVLRETSGPIVDEKDSKQAKKK